jgi:hypothetical protein
MALSRRSFLAAQSAVMFSFYVAGCEKRTTPAAARKEQIPFRFLTAAEAASLDALAEHLVVGARAAGFSHFLDVQLSGPAANNILMLKYLAPPPFTDFYRAALAAIDAAAIHSGAKPFAALDSDAQLALIKSLNGPNPAGWPATAPPSGFAYFVLRNDAIDLVYGNMEAFERLGFPYMPHIAPVTPWPV